MNLLIILHRFPAYGGIERVTTILANHFAEHHRVDIAAAKQDFSSPVYALSSKVHVHKLPHREPGHKLNLHAVHDLCIGCGTDVVLVQSSNGEFRRLTSYLHQHIDVKIVTCLHMSLMRARPKLTDDSWKNYIKRMIRPLYLWYLEQKQLQIHRKVYRSSDCYVLLSPSYIPQYKLLLKPKDGGKKLRAIPNPCDIWATDSDVPRRHEIVYVGRLDKEQKCVGRLLEIWEDLSVCFPDWRLRIVGDGPDRQNLEQQAAKMKHVMFDGFQPNTSSYFQECSICCLVSDFEGLPMTLIEAATLGCIPVAYDTFISIKDIIIDGRNGYIISAYDKQMYISRLAQLMSDVSLRKVLSQHARVDAEQFQVQPVLQKWESLLEELFKTTTEELGDD